MPRSSQMSEEFLCCTRSRDQGRCSSFFVYLCLSACRLILIPFEPEAQALIVLPCFSCVILKHPLSPKHPKLFVAYTALLRIPEADSRNPLLKGRSRRAVPETLIIFVLLASWAYSCSYKSVFCQLKNQRRA